MKKNQLVMALDGIHSFKSKIAGKKVPFKFTYGLNRNIDALNSEIKAIAASIQESISEVIKEIIEVVKDYKNEKKSTTTLTLCWGFAGIPLPAFDVNSDDPETSKKAIERFNEMNAKIDEVTAKHKELLESVSEELTKSDADYKPYQVDINEDCNFETDIDITPIMDMIKS